MLNIREVSINDINLALVKENDFIFFRTGFIEKISYDSDLYFLNHPQLSNELIKKLLEKKIRFIGVDCASIRQNEEHVIADKLCEDNNCYVIENISNLDKIDKEIFLVYTMWLDDDKITGLKTRVIA